MRQSERWLRRLKESGYRLTAPRRAVVEVVTTSARALNPNEVFELARRSHPTLGLVTVYRTLERLEHLDLVQRVHLPEGCHAYLPACEGHEHLLICRECGLTEYFSGDDLDPLITAVERNSGYSISDHWLQLLGRCSVCQSAAA